MPSRYENMYVGDVEPRNRIPRWAVVTAGGVDFYNRVYNGVDFRAGHRLRHLDYCITPRHMREADWDSLGHIFGDIDLRAEYRRITGEEPRCGLGPRMPYVRHYEIEPLSLPE